VKKPLLSVCIITYNHAQYIREAIDSILAQQVDFAWELIVADDCSTDGTRGILLEYKQKYPDLIHLILQKKNVGPERNWMDLLEHPKTKYVLYGEADDYFTDITKLQRQVDFLEKHKDFALCFHSVRIVYEDGSQPDELFPSPPHRRHKTVFELSDVLRDNFIQTNSAMYRWRFIHENVKQVFPKGIAPGDWFLHILHAEKGKVGFIDRPMAVYRRHPGSLWWNAYKNKDALWKKHGVAHLAFYVQLLERYGADSKNKNIIYGHISDMLVTFAVFDDKYGDTLLADTTAHFPAHTQDFLSAQSYALQAEAKILAGKNAELLEKGKEITQLHQTIYNKDVRLKQLEQELQKIKNSKVWRARNKFAKLAGREAV
jgi:glycosyltransferase involved in cell wall biosynthesis